MSALDHAKDIILVAEQLAEVDEHRDSHELEEFESCEICGENGKWAHLNRHYERLTRDYGLALAKRCLELTEQRERGGGSAKEFWGSYYGTGAEYADQRSCEFAEAYASSRLAEVSAQRDALQQALDMLGGPRRCENCATLRAEVTELRAEVERLTTDKKVLQALIEDYQKAVDDSGQHHLIAPENVRAEFDKLRHALQFIASQEDLLFAECSLAEEITTAAREALGRTSDACLGCYSSAHPHKEGCING